MADRKKHARSGHRSSTTKLLTRIDEALRASPLDGDWIASLKMSLNEKLEKLKTLDREIEELLDGEDELAEEIERTDEYMERVHEAVAKLNKVLNPRLSSADSVTRPTASAEPVTQPPAPPAARTVKLPRLTLPRFSGNILKWSSFWDSYASAVHNNPDLSDVDKFNYLRSLLEGSAYDAIAGLTLSSATYSEAIEILGKRYGDKQVIITKHMEKLLGTEAVESDKNLRGLRRLHDDVESHIRSLYALGVAPESYGAMLTPVLINKLPPEVRLEISRKFTGDVPEVDKILKAVEEELRARERMLSHMHTAAPHRQHEKPRTPTTMLYTSSRFTKPTCCYCQEPHPSNDCIKIKDTNARKQILRSGGRCFNCLGRGHISRTCRSSSRCSKCKGRHHSSICESHDSPRSLVKPNPANSTTLNPSATPFTSTSSNLCSSKNKTVLLQTARAQIYNLSTPRHPVEVRLLLDSGSQRSYLSERARAMLALESVGEQKLAISTFGSTQEQQQSCPVVKVGMKVNGSPPMNLSLFVVPVVCEPLFSQPVSVCVSEYPHLASLSLADETDGASRLDVDLLIGSDFYWDIVTGGVSRGAQGPVAIHTKLGWVLSGPAQHENTTKVSTNLITTHVLKVDSQPTNADLEKELQSFWDLESLGIVGPEKTLYDQFLSTVTTKNNRYEVTLPWKEHHKALPDNYQLSLRRLKGLLHRLRQAPAVLQQYHSIISDQLKQGIVEPAPDNGNLCHYLPHHAVIREDKMTTKLRIVYDASARSEDAPSLNDCIHKGPKFNQIILDLLLRFRQFRVPLIADLEKAFLQVSVAEDDRDVLRFLWIDDITKENPDVCALRFTRVVFGLAASPFLLNATVRHHLQKYATSHPALVQRLLQSMYVDDIITGANTEDEAFQLYEQSKRLFQEAGFNLRKFVTNRRSLQLRINHAEQACASQQQESQEMNYSDETYGRATLGITVDTEAEEQKVLGLRWRPGDDLLLFDTSTILQLASSVKPTKRNVISVVGKFYDPLGFLGPVIIRFKVFFQRLCSNKIAWDQPLPAVLLQEWKHLLDNSLGGPPLTIPRSYSASHDAVVVSHHLCGFCDASSHAFAAVIYLARVTEEKTKISFVTAKTRVAPSRPHTIPRLELLPALLLSRLIVSVANCLQPLLQHIEFKCFTDSQVTQYWIEGVHKEWKPFIQNRVEEIRRAVPPSCWAHCPGDTNPADLPSRGVSQSELLVSRLWHFGPDWLPAVVTSQEDKSMPAAASQCPRNVCQN